MGLEVIAIASLVMATAGTAYSIHENQEAKKDAKKAAADQMAANERAAQSEADRIQFNADRLKKAQRASASTAGLVSDQGTALDVQNETSFLAAKDIGTVLESKNTANQGVLNEAKMFSRRANASSVSSLISLGSTALGTYGNYKQGQNLLEAEKTRLGKDNFIKQKK